jgi:hypothetical protein
MTDLVEVGGEGETPRTDAAVNPAQFLRRADGTFTEIVNAVTCRQLERELAAAIEQRDTLLVAFDKYGQHLRKCINTKDNSCDCGFISIYYAIRRMKECGK